MPQPKRHWFKSRWLLAATATICSLMAISFVKELVRSYRINQEIASLKTEIDKLQDNNQKTSSFVEYLKTDTYFQEQARLKLGMKQQGEKVIVLQPTDASSTSAVNTRGSDLNDLLRNRTEPSSNPGHWLTYFFGARS